VDPYHQKNFASIHPAVFTPYIDEIYTPSVWNLLHFFGFSTPTGESVRPIFMLNMSNDVVRRLYIHKHRGRPQYVGVTWTGSRKLLVCCSHFRRRPCVDVICTVKHCCVRTWSMSAVLLSAGSAAHSLCLFRTEGGEGWWLMSADHAKRKWKLANR